MTASPYSPGAGEFLDGRHILGKSRDTVRNAAGQVYGPPLNVPERWREGPPASNPHGGESEDW